MPTEGVNILHVEDNPADAHWLKVVLNHALQDASAAQSEEMSPAEIIRVKSCAEAKARLSQGNIQAILLDLGLPDETGLETLQQITSEAHGIPIVVLTGAAEPDASSQSIQKGAQDYLVKGRVGGREIWRSLSTALERQRFWNYQLQVFFQMIGEDQAKLKALMEMAFDGIALFKDRVIKIANSAFDQILGYEPGETVERPMITICDTEYNSYFLSQVGRNSEGPMVVPARKKDGTPLILQFAVRSCLLEGEKASVITIRDVTEKEKSAEALREQAYLDPLTGLPNRFLFLDRLNMSLEKARRTETKVALMFLDLDRFKLTNDTLGHHVGDELLQAVAKRLQETIRKSDTIARLGGDEFTLILSDIQSLEEPYQIARNIIEALGKPFELQRHELRASASIGISLFPDHAQNAEKLLQKADMAMYRAKEKGRNNFQAYHASMDPGGLDRLGLESDLYKALEKEEFHLVYQPQVDLETNRMVGVEALLRWTHPSRGPISPEEFIPLAEETGLINPLGQWVIRQACAQNREWQKEGLPPIRMSINLSAVQFLKHTLPFMIDKTLKETGLEQKYLDLEITEGVAMRNPAFTLAVLRDLTEILKVRITLDDFGIAHSSLGYLKKFPIHCLKIDKSFVAGITEGTKDQAIVNAIIVLARNLGLEIIAEGVETQEQLEFLKKQGCHTCQGYFFSKPIPPEEIRKLLQHPFQQAQTG